MVKFPLSHYWCCLYQSEIKRSMSGQLSALLFPPPPSPVCQDNQQDIKLISARSSVIETFLILSLSAAAEQNIWIFFNLQILITINGTGSGWYKYNKGRIGLMRLLTNLCCQYVNPSLGLLMLMFAQLISDLGTTDGLLVISFLSF